MLGLTACHVIRFPNGRYGYVGRVPRALCRIVKADRSAIMGGRYHIDGNGDAMEAKGRVFDSAEEARAYAAECGVPIGPERTQGDA